MARRKETVLLSKTRVERIKPDPNRRLLVWDSAIPSLAVRVTPAGAKSFVLLFRNQAGRQRWDTLGTFPVMSIELAREAAQARLKTLASGKDPAAEKQRARRTPTLAAFWADYERDYAAPNKKAASVRNDRYVFNSHIAPALGDKPVSEIKKADAALLHARMKANPYQANRTLALLSKLMNLATEWGWRDETAGNPCRFVKRYREPARKRFMAPDEVAALGGALATVEREKLADPAVVQAIRLIALLGARRGEILGLRWSEVNFERGRLELEDSKTGEKVVYLNTAAALLLAERKRRRADPVWVFPGRVKGQPLREIKKTWALVVRLAGIENLHLHDLRKAYGSSAVSSLKMSLPMTAALLGHKTTRVTERHYAELQDEPLKAAAEAVGGHIADLLAGSAANVETIGGGDRAEDESKEATQ